MASPGKKQNGRSGNSTGTCNRTDGRRHPGRLPYWRIIHAQILVRLASWRTRRPAGCCLFLYSSVLGRSNTSGLSALAAMHWRQGHAHMNEGCVFCAIAADEPSGSGALWQRQTITLPDPLQPHGGHLLVMPRNHFEDVRDMDEVTIEAVILAIQRGAQVIAMEFAGDGVSVWHSSRQQPCCSTAHAHFHVRPRHVVRQRPADIDVSCTAL